MKSGRKGEAGPKADAPPKILPPRPAEDRGAEQTLADRAKTWCHTRVGIKLQNRASRYRGVEIVLHCTSATSPTVRCRPLTSPTIGRLLRLECDVKPEQTRC